MHGLSRRCGRFLIRSTIREKSTAAEIESVGKAEEEKVQKVATASTVYRPPYYRKPHKHHEAQHLLQEEFPNAGDASGAGVRLFDYFKTAEIVNSLPTIKEKIEFVSPYERPWTRAERTWRRDWHPTLMATRKAWGIPTTPNHFETLEYYKFLTKSRVEHGSLDDIYEGLRPPILEFQKNFISTLNSMNFEDGLKFEDDETQKLLGTMIDDAMGGIAHNVARLADLRLAYDVESEAFWIRSGFQFLYEDEEIGTKKVVKRLNNFPKFIGDDRRKLGELAFVNREKLAAQVRSREPLAALHSLESQDATKPIFDNGTNQMEEEIYSPKVYNLWPDEQPLWQCPGYHADSGETHTNGILAIKSLRPLRRRVAYWMGWEDEGEMIDLSEEAKQMLDEGARAQAVVSLFTTLCAQAHTHGFTQYTDVTRPFTSQIVLSDGINFYFAVGQLNTLAINIECDGFVNPKTNYVRIEGPFKLFDIYEKNQYSTIVDEISADGKTSGKKLIPGLNKKVLERITQFLMKQ